MTKAEIDILKNALLLLGRKEVEEYKALPQEDFVFSKEFEEKVVAINKRRKSFFYQATKTTPRKIAIVFVAAIIMLTMTMSISAIRKPILNFFTSIYESFITIFVEADEELELPTSIEQIYKPTYLPEEYIEISSENYEFEAISMWMKNASAIILSQNTISEETKISIDNKETDYQTTTISGNSVYYYIKDGYYYLIWSNNYIFSLTAPSDIPFDEIKKIISSITPSE